jgi:MinD superfamily P-loop ATPase
MGVYIKYHQSTRTALPFLILSQPHVCKWTTNNNYTGAHFLCDGCAIYHFLCSCFCFNALSLIDCRPNHVGHNYKFAP